MDERVELVVNNLLVQAAPHGYERVVDNCKRGQCACS